MKPPGRPWPLSFRYTLVCMNAPFPCPTKTALLNEYGNATKLYADAVGELAQRIGIVPRDEYERLRMASKSFAGYHPTPLRRLTRTRRTRLLNLNRDIASDKGLLSAKPFAAMLLTVNSRTHAGRRVRFHPEKVEQHPCGSLPEYIVLLLKSRYDIRNQRSQFGGGDGDESF